VARRNRVANQALEPPGGSTDCGGAQSVHAGADADAVALLLSARELGGKVLAAITEPDAMRPIGVLLSMYSRIAFASGAP